MKEWWNEFWNTKAGFERVTRTLMYFVGTLMQAGVIPTGIPNGGSILGPILAGSSLMVGAGEKNTTSIDAGGVMRRIVPLILLVLLPTLAIQACGPRLASTTRLVIVDDHSDFLSEADGFFRCDADGYNRGVAPACMDQFRVWYLNRFGVEYNG